MMGVPEELPTLDCDATREEASKESERERGRRERGVKVDRRDFLKKSGAVVAGGLLADLGILEQAAAAAAAKRTEGRPNIVFILVDEMRFPSVFPAGVDTPAEFLRRFMPNVFSLWQHGVKFEDYYSSGNACSPARRDDRDRPVPASAVAARDADLLEWAGAAARLPTYGKLLRQFGYDTPYFGKWHSLQSTASPSTVGYLRTTASRDDQPRPCRH